MRDNPTVEQVLQANVMLPEVDTSREFWGPTADHVIELSAIEDMELRAARANAMFLQWRRANLDDVVASQASTGKGGTTVKTAEDGVIATSDGA